MKYFRYNISKYFNMNIERSKPFAQISENSKLSVN